MKEISKVRKIAFVGDHLPRKCGIATFTSDLLAAVAHQRRHAGPAGPRPHIRRLFGVLVARPAAADGRPPDEVEVLGRRADAVEAPCLGTQERGHLDAVAGVLNVDELGRRVADRS